MSDYCVYIITNNSGTLYVGVPNNLEGRVYEHKRGVQSGSTIGEPTEIPCESYQEQSGDSYHIFFRRWNVAAGLSVYWIEPNHPSDQAISLAHKQASRIEAALEGDNSR